MARDLRNEFLQNVKIVLTGLSNADSVLFNISTLLESYELSERVTSIVPKDTANLNLIKTYISSLLIDGKQRSTIEHYTRELKKFMNYFNDRDLKELKSFDIKNYLANKKLGGLSNRTLNNVRDVISSFYK